DAAEAAQRPRGEAVHLALDRMVALIGVAPAAERLDEARRLLDGFRPPVGARAGLARAAGHDHRRPGLREPAGDAAPDAAGRAGDDADAVREGLARHADQPARAASASASAAAPVITVCARPRAPVAMFSAKKRASAMRPAWAGLESPAARASLAASAAIASAVPPWAMPKRRR